jgi:O-antigen ligase
MIFSFISVDKKPLLSRENLAAIISLVSLILLYLLWQKFSLVYQQPPFWFIAFACACVLIGFKWMPLQVSLFWLAGFATILWSIAPGNTLVYGLWEILFIAGFLAGSWRTGFYFIATLLTCYGLYRVILLSLDNGLLYFSGSIPFMTGAVALTLVPLSLYHLIHLSKNWQKLGYFLLLLLSTYTVLASGSRAVYLGLVFVFPVIVGRLIWERKRVKSVILWLLILSLVMFVVEFLIPTHPVQAALFRASNQPKVEASQQMQSGGERFKLWSQALDMILDNPLGVGVGGYQEVSHVYQKFPMVWSNSPHNYYLEVLATGGWLRLLLLLAILIPGLYQTWKSRSWAWSLSALGLWITLAFDVTALFPSFLMFAFWSLGTLFSLEKQIIQLNNPIRISIASLAIVGMAGLIGWWYIPCHSSDCALKRYRGVDFKVNVYLQELSKSEQLVAVEELKNLYPKSLSVLRLKQRVNEGAEQSLAVAREIATRFPYQNPQNYLDWAMLAMQAGNNQEAEQAILSGLAVFPENSNYGEWRMTSETREQWISEAHKILDVIKASH